MWKIYQLKGDVLSGFEKIDYGYEFNDREEAREFLEAFIKDSPFRRDDFIIVRKTDND